MSNVRIYSCSTCKDCDRAKEYFRQRGIPFEDIDILKNKSARDEMAHKYGVHVTPVVVVDDHVMVGFNHLKLDKLFHTH